MLQHRHVLFFGRTFYLHYISFNMMICLFFMHLPKCFSVAVKLLCFIRKVVCSAANRLSLHIFVVYHHVPRVYSAIIVEQAEVFMSIGHLKLDFFVNNVFDLCCITHG